MMKKKSPIKGNPLRNPGQSVQEEAQKIIEDEAYKYIFIAVFISVIAFLEWARYLIGYKPTPYLYTFMAASAVVYSYLKLKKIKIKLKSMRQGYKGELVVGQFLEQVRTMGADVFHDLLFDNFNIDHVIVSDKGIFAVETKTYSKPEKGEAIIQYTGDILDIDGIKTEKPLIQAKAAANSLSQLIKESTGKSIPVHPAVLFPGWYIDSVNHNVQDKLWVLNPKALPAFIEKRQKILSLEDQKLVSYHLSRYIRTRVIES